MNEFVSSLTVLWCTVTYWLGGQQIPWTGKGYLWIRRVLMPIGLCAGLIFLGVVPYKASIACILLSAATHLGYQDKIWKFFATAACMSAPSVIIGYHWTVFLPIFVQPFFGWISLKDPRFKWAYVALLMGASLGIAYVAAIP